MAESRFVYVTYIRAPAEKIWEAITTPEQNRKFWSGYHQETSWQVGADYAIVSAEGVAWDAGKVLEIDPPRRLSVSWLHLKHEDMKADGLSTATFDLEPASEGVTKLTLTHSVGVSPSKLIEGVSRGWPGILSSLKSLMETGEAIG